MRYCVNAEMGEALALRLHVMEASIRNFGSVIFEMTLKMQSIW